MMKKGESTNTWGDTPPARPRNRAFCQAPINQKRQYLLGFFAVGGCYESVTKMLPASNTYKFN